MSDQYQFVIVRFERFVATEDPNYLLPEIKNRCNQFRVQAIAADGRGNGLVYNRILFDGLANRCLFYAIVYSVTDSDPVKNGVLWDWTVNRSASIGNVFARVKRKTLAFPCVADCGSFLDEFACEISVHDNFKRTVIFDHPTNQPDDALHAANYAHLVGTRLHAHWEIHPDD